MTLATLDSIKTAILEKLRTERDDVGGPFQCVDNFGGSLAQNAAQEMINQLFSLAPAVLLACAGESYEIGSRAGAPVTLAGGSKGVVGTSFWNVYVVSTSLETTRTTTEPAITSRGIYDLVSLAVGSLVGLEIEGLYRSDTLAAVDSKPYWWKRDQYVWLSRFSARRWLKNVEMIDDSAPFEEIDADVSVPDTGESVAMPIVQFKADFTE